MNDALVILAGIVILSEVWAVFYWFFKIVKTYTDFLNSQGGVDE